MTTVYKYKKCDVFGFAKSIKNICVNGYDKDLIIYRNKPTGEEQKAADINTDNDDLTEDEITELTKLKKEYEKYEETLKDKSVIIYDFDSKDESKNIKMMENIAKIGEGKTIIIDLSSNWMNDIDIATDKDKDASDISTASFKHDDQTFNKAMTGQSTQLEAFSSNRYTVIYGKKTAGIQASTANPHIFNHNVIDSLAKNGVVVDIKTDTELRILKFMRELEKLRKFNIFFIHPSYDLEYSEYESPSDISNPTYIKGKGEICAIAYRALILRFFPYLTILTESMREDAYLF